jgi:hypothetical protein
VEQLVPWLTGAGTVYGKQYYTIMPPMWEQKDWKAMMKWCEDTFGPTGSLWQESKNLTPESNKRWYANNSKFWFLDEKDLLIFVMKWR